MNSIDRIFIFVCFLLLGSSQDIEAQDRSQGSALTIASTDVGRYGEPSSDAQPRYYYSLAVAIEKRGGGILQQCRVEAWWSDGSPVERAEVLETFSLPQGKMRISKSFRIKAYDETEREDGGVVAVMCDEEFSRLEPFKIRLAIRR